MKKIYYYFLCISFLFLFFSCSNNKNTMTKKNDIKNKKIIQNEEYFFLIGYGQSEKFKFENEALKKQSSFKKARLNAFENFKNILKINEKGYFDNLILIKNHEIKEYEKKIEEYFYNLKVMEVEWDNENNCFVKYKINYSDFNVQNK